MFFLGACAEGLLGARQGDPRPPGQARPLCHSGASSCHTSPWSLPGPFLRPPGHPLHSGVFHRAGCSSSPAAFRPVWISVCSSVSDSTGWVFILGPDSYASLSQEVLRSHEPLHSWLKEDDALHTTGWSTAARLAWAPQPGLQVLRLPPGFLPQRHGSSFSQSRSSPAKGEQQEWQRGAVQEPGSGWEAVASPVRAAQQEGSSRGCTPVPASPAMGGGRGPDPPLRPSLGNHR